MSAWYSTVDRLRACVLALESFVDVRIRKISTLTPAGGQLAPAAWQDLELHRPTPYQHRKIVFVVTDGVGALWRHGHLWGHLQSWADHHTVAVLNVLPHGNWRRSALSTKPCQLKACRPVCPNSGLIEVHAQDPAPADEPETTAVGTTVSDFLPIPVLELHREWLGKWIHMMTSAIPVQQHVLQPPTPHLPCWFPPPPQQPMTQPAAR